MTDGSYRRWEPDKYTDYMVNDGLFVVLKYDKWVGIYNLNSVKEIKIDDED